jgi:hypothetical protein
LYVLRIAFGFEVAVALALDVAVVLIGEQAMGVDVLERTDVTSISEPDDEDGKLELVDNLLLELVADERLEVVEDTSLVEELNEPFVEVEAFVGVEALLEVETLLEVEVFVEIGDFDAVVVVPEGGAIA